MTIDEIRAWKAKCLEWEAKCLKEYGFYMHFVAPLEGHEGTLKPEINHHTHGILEGLGHLDLQITFPLDPDRAGDIFHSFYGRIKAGEKFAPGQRVSGILKRYDVLLIEAREGGRTVLRIIMPEKDGNLDRETMAPKWFAEQFEHLDQTTGGTLVTFSQN